MNGESYKTRDEALRQLDVSTALASLRAPVPPPPGLTNALRVIALRERQRHLTKRSARELWAGWCDRLGLVLTNVARPMAVPIVGGVFSAILLFSIWLAPTYPAHAGSESSDVPIMLTVATDPILMGTAPIAMEGADLVVEVSVDDQGHMVDYKIVSGGDTLLRDAAFRRRLENSLLFTEFAPGTAFGHRIAGKVRIPIISSTIIVKG